MKTKLRDWVLAQPFEVQKDLANHLYLSVSELEIFLNDLIDYVPIKDYVDDFEDKFLGHLKENIDNLEETYLNELMTILESRHSE